MIEVDGETFYTRTEKTEAEPGQRMSFRGIELVAVPLTDNVIKCKSCAISAYRIHCDRKLPCFCSNVVFMTPLDAITFKLTGVSPNGNTETR